MAKRKRPAAPPLAHSWNVPTDIEPEEGIGQPVACLATTYEFHAGFFETELLPRFLGQQLDNTENELHFIFEREMALATTTVAVLVDRDKLDAGQTTLSWDQLPVAVPGGIQHSKLTLLVWENFIRLIVASANLTTPGYRKNREVFAAIDFFNDGTSAPLQLLYDALDFLALLANWLRALPAATNRLRAAVEEVRRRVGAWQFIPEDFGLRERPRVKLIVGHPRQNDVPARSPMGQLVDFCPRSRLEEITVVTPFVGQNAAGIDPVVDRLLEFPVGRGTTGWLVAPEIPQGDEATRRAVPLPALLKDQWQRHFHQREGARVLPVPLTDERVDRNRNLHSKAILLSGDKYDVLMVGSSNFTSHGQGVGAYNCEANLAFQDHSNTRRAKLTLENRLDLDDLWELAAEVDEVEWRSPTDPPEDSPGRRAWLPLFFGWASYSQRTGVIQVQLDRDQPEPLDWSIRLAGETRSDAPALFSRPETPSATDLLKYEMPESARAAHLVALRVEWNDQGVKHDARLAISVEDKADILPVADTLNLSVDTIIDCLLRGKDPRPSESPSENGDRNGKRKRNDASIDSLRAVDTSGYLLYRVRRLGRALAAVARRLRQTPPTPQAIRYRLLHDPLGPVRLVTAICEQDLSSDEDQDNRALLGEQRRVERIYRLYTVAETILCVAHAGNRLRRRSVTRYKPVSGLFREAVQAIRALRGPLLDPSDERPLPANLETYLQEVSRKAGTLLGRSRKEGIHAG